MKCTLESIFRKCYDGRYLDRQDEHAEMKLLNDFPFLVTELTLQLNTFLCKTLCLQLHSAVRLVAASNETRMAAGRRFQEIMYCVQVQPNEKNC